MEILKFPDVRLRFMADRLPSQEELPCIVAEMTSVMKEHKGIGLAATQVNLPYKLFIMKLPDKDKLWVVQDPQILRADKGIRLCEEGCLSIPNVWAKVERYRRIYVKYLDENNQTVKCTLEGLTGCVWQHEMDHLSGILFVDRLSKTKKDELFKEHKRIDGVCDGYDYPWVLNS